MRISAASAALALAAAAVALLPVQAPASSSEVRRGVTSLLLDGGPRAYAAKVEINDSVRAWFLVATGATIGASEAVVRPKQK